MQSDEEVGKVAQAVPIIIYILFKPEFIDLFCFSLTFFIYVSFTHNILHNIP